MISAQVHTYGAELVAAELEGMAQRASSMRPIWPEVNRRLERIMREQFESEGARGGERWPELSYGWLYHKFRTGQSLTILRASEEMYDALTGTTSDSIRNETDTTFEFGADLDQFRIQQDYSPASNFPERRPINLTMRDEEEFAELFEQYVLGSVNRRGQFINRQGRFTGGSVGRVAR